MNEHDNRLHDALEYVGNTTRAESRLHAITGPKTRRRPALLAAGAGFLLVLALAVPLAG
jgi:hypothetical protein